MKSPGEQLPGLFLFVLPSAQKKDLVVEYQSEDKLLKPGF
jgi:hypothetical protein